MNAKERRNYIKTNAPRVKTMAAKLKLVDMPKRAERLLEMFASEADWFKAIEITTQYEKALPSVDFILRPGQWWIDDVMDKNPFTVGVGANAFFPKVKIKHGTSKSDRISNLQAAQLARQRAKAEMLPREEVQITRPRIDFGTSTVSMVDHQLDNLAYSRYIRDELMKRISK